MNDWGQPKTDDTVPAVPAEGEGTTPAAGDMPAEPAAAPMTSGDDTAKVGEEEEETDEEKPTDEDKEETAGETPKTSDEQPV